MRRVSFSHIPTTILTHSNEDYDRTSTEIPDKLTYQDILELLEIRGELRRQYENEPESLCQ
jgi:hypothetical protein